MKIAKIPSDTTSVAIQHKTAAEAHLSKSCSVMAMLIQKHGPCMIGDQPGDAFETLASAIISQQLSSKAARTILHRIIAITGDLTPGRFLEASREELRNAGLSSAKLRYITELAQYEATGGLQLEALQRKSDDDVIAVLTGLPGVGRWTAEMFLIFGLKRPDVLALDDAGLQRAVRLLYGEKKTLAAVGTRWRPYASTASWYLWRHLDA